MGAITRLRKKAVEVTAMQWTGDNEKELISFTGGNFQAIDPEDRGDDPDATGQVYDKLHSTWVLVYPGQWIIKGVKGEFYPIAEDVLAETYEPVGEAPAGLPQYSGEDSTCPKCGHAGASTQFLPYGRCQHGSDTLVLGWEPNERLHRECGNCSYAWDEATTEQAPGREVTAS